MTRKLTVIVDINSVIIPEIMKKDLVELLTTHDIPLIENDVSGEIHFTAKRPLTAKSYDTEGLVLLCSSFS